MKAPPLLILGMAAAMAFMVPPSKAAVLALYDFQGYTSTSAAPYASADSDPNSTAGGFTPASGLGSNGNWNSTANGIDTVTSGDPLPSFAQKLQSTITTQALSYSGDAYISFTLTPSSGFELSLTGLEIDIKTFNSNQPSFYLSSDIGGFGNPIGSVVDSFYANLAFSKLSFDLTGAAFQNLTSPVEFRLYMWWTGSGTSSGSATRFDNVTLNGTVSAIPEPGSSLLIGVGLALILWRFRRS